MAAREETLFHQYGALPYLIAEGGDIRVLLVTTRGRQDWIIPKGWPIRRLTPAATAAREAFEEAGLIGNIVGDEPCGSFSYEKPRSARRRTLFHVSVFLFAVERQLRKWPEKSERTTRWFSPTEAASLVGPAGLGEILRAEPTWSNLAGPVTG
jgi:8-oxo-dGTP pyrophosphatase MutT (NUDIX family)